MKHTNFNTLTAEFLIKNEDTWPFFLREDDKLPHKAHNLPAPTMSLSALPAEIIIKNRDKLYKFLLA